MQNFNIDTHYGRSITINGREHKVNPVLLRDHMEGGFAVESARKLAGVEAGNVKEWLDLTVEFIKHYIPSLTNEDIDALDIEAFVGLIDYIKGERPEDILSKNARRAETEIAETTETTETAQVEQATND